MLIDFADDVVVVVVVAVVVWELPFCWATAPDGPRWFPKSVKAKYESAHGAVDSASSKGFRPLGLIFVVTPPSYVRTRSFRRLSQLGYSPVTIEPGNGASARMAAAPMRGEAKVGRLVAGPDTQLCLREGRGLAGPAATLGNTQPEQ